MKKNKVSQFSHGWKIMKAIWSSAGINESNSIASRNRFVAGAGRGQGAGWRVSELLNVQCMTREGWLLALKGKAPQWVQTRTKKRRRLVCQFHWNGRNTTNSWVWTGPCRRFGPKDVMVLLYYFIIYIYRHSHWILGVQ